MDDSGTKRCVVAYASHDHQYLWTVDLPAQATIADVLKAARGIAAETRTTRGTREELGQIPWESAPVGIFGVLCNRQAIPGDGDRIEIYRPLKSDPRDRRRERVRRERVSKRG